jgi:hypothetical protein
MKRTVALAALMVALLVWLPPLLRRRSSDPPARPPRRPPAHAESPALPAGVTPSLPERNVFEYAEPRAAPAPIVAPRPIAPPSGRPPAATEAVPEPVRLVGLVRRAGRPRAVLSILGEVVVLAAGEESEGYRVVSVDEEAGVRLRAPDGSERTLARPESP